MEDRRHLGVFCFSFSPLHLWRAAPVRVLHTSSGDRCQRRYDHFLPPEPHLLSFQKEEMIGGHFAGHSPQAPTDLPTPSQLGNLPRLTRPQGKA